MLTTTVKHTIAAPVSEVFDRISDHAAYRQFPGIRASRLLREGRNEKNGLGAIREIEAGRARFVEEITAFERPWRMDYRILESRPAIEHAGGSIRLEETPAGTAVTWTSTYRLKAPLVGGLMTRIAAPNVERMFLAILKAIAERPAP